MVGPPGPASGPRRGRLPPPLLYLFPFRRRRERQRHRNDRDRHERQDGVGLSLGMPHALHGRRLLLRRYPRVLRPPP